MPKFTQNSPYDIPKAVNNALVVNQFEEYLSNILGGKMSASNTESFISKSNISCLPGSKAQLRMTNNLNQSLTNGKHKRQMGWNWAECMSKRLGAPSMVKLDAPGYPMLGCTDGDIMPPKLYTETLASDEEGDLIAKATANNDFDQVGVSPLDGNDPYIYSTEVGVPPYSFLDDQTEYTKKSPPPTYILYSVLSKPKPTKKKEVLFGLECNKNGVLQCVDKEMLEKSKGVVSYVVKQIAKNIFSGLGVVAISLPVRIFEPRSALERVLDGFSYAPKYLNDACKTSDPAERMKLVVAFIVSGIYMRANTRKPFNPLLGETLQGQYSDGTKIYMEHTSHHPPISNYLLEGPPGSDYKFYGSNEFVGNIKSAGNILNIIFRGPNVIEFPNGDVITFTNPASKVKGLMMGDKLIFMEGVVEFYDETNSIKSVIFMEPKKRELEETDDPNYFEGVIYEYDPAKTTKNLPDKISAIKDMDDKICDVYGSWLENLVIDETEYWDIEEAKPSRIQFPQISLPSDARYREDLIWLFYKDEKYAQEWKSLLEVQQRKERKNRQNCEKKRKKGKFKFIENF